MKFLVLKEFVKYQVHETSFKNVLATKTIRQQQLQLEGKQLFARNDI